jgi:hypothetical protein
VNRWAVFDLNGTLIARQTVLITQREAARTPLHTSQGPTRQGNTDLNDLRAPTGAEPHKIGRAESAI